MIWVINRLEFAIAPDLAKHKNLIFSFFLSRLFIVNETFLFIFSLSLNALSPIHRSISVAPPCDVDGYTEKQNNFLYLCAMMFLTWCRFKSVKQLNSSLHSLQPDRGMKKKESNEQRGLLFISVITTAASVTASCSFIDFLLQRSLARALYVFRLRIFKLEFFRQLIPFYEDACVVLEAKQLLCYLEGYQTLLRKLFRYFLISMTLNYYI